MYLSARKYINKIDWNLLNVNSDLPYSEATRSEYTDVVKVAGLDHRSEEHTSELQSH